MAAEDVALGAGAKLFVEVMEGWCKADNPDAPSAMRSAGKCLSDWAKEYIDPILFESKTAIVGDESSGKTALATRFLQSVIMVMDEKTATKCRTEVVTNYVPGVEHKRCDFIFEKKNINMTDISTDELLAKHIATFATEQVSSDVCKITIKTGEQSMGMGVIDHPGFVARAEQETTQCFEDTMHQLYLGPHPAKFANVVLVHSINQRPEQAHYVKHCKLFSEVPEGRLYVAITKADMLNPGSITQERLSKRFPKNPQNKYEVSAWDIMETLIDSVRSPLADDSIELPSHTQFYFTCGYGGSSDDLKDDGDGAWETFKKGALKNEQKLLKFFTSPDKWADFDVILKPMTEEEKEKFHARLGFDKLQDKIFSSQKDCWKLAIRELQSPSRSDGMAKKIESLDAQLREARRQCFGSAPKINSLTQEFLHLYNLAFCVMAGPADMDFPSETGNTRQQQICQDIRSTWHALTTPPMVQGEDGKLIPSSEPEIGWTTEEEIEQFKCLNRQGEFPREERSIKSVYGATEAKEFDAQLPKLVPNYDRRLHTLPTMYQRLQAEYAIKTQSVAIPRVTEDMVLAKTRNCMGVMAPNIMQALQTHIADEYNKIYVEKKQEGCESANTRDAGNVFVANRIALCAALHGQAVLTTFNKLSHFEQLFQDEDGDVCEASLLNGLKFFSRFQNRDMMEESEFVKGVKELKSEQMNLGDLKMYAQDRQQKFFGDGFGPLVLEDIQKLLTAHYFDQVYEDLLRELDTTTTEITQCMPAYGPASMHFSAVFLHQDEKFMGTYYRYRPLDNWTKAFSSDAPKDQEGDGYDDGRERPFASICAENVKVVAECCNKLPTTRPVDRAYLLGNLIGMATAPDVVVPIENVHHLNKFEQESMNFVAQRNITAAVKNTLDDVNKKIAVTSYRFGHPAKIAENLDVLMERLLSILLGYNYPFTSRDRPPKFHYLSLDVVIPFMFRHRCALSGGLMGQDAKTDLPGTTHETKIFASHLFQAVCQKIWKNDQGKEIVDEKGADEVNAKIKEWYELWVLSFEDGATHRKFLNESLVQFLLSSRYSSPSHDKLRKRIQELNRSKADWCRVRSYMKSFSKLVDQHGEDLLAKNVPEDKVNIKPDTAPEEHLLHAVDEPQAAPRQEARSDVLTHREIWKKKSRRGN